MCTVIEANECLTTLLLEFHTNKFVADLRQNSFIRKNGHFALLSPLGGLEATIAVYLRLIGKPVSDLLFSDN